MTEKSKRIWYISLQIASFLISAGVPIVVIWQKFPNWVKCVPMYKQIGYGAVLAVLVLIGTFHKTVFRTIREKLGITSVPPVIGWAVAWGIFEFLTRAVKFLVDMRVVCFAGLIGCAIGMACSAISVMIYPKGKKEKKHEEPEEPEEKE